MKVEIKKVDNQGRLILPYEWRVKALGGVNEVILVMFDDYIKIIPRNVDLAHYINSVEVDVENFADYHKLRRELRSKGRGH